MDFPEPEGPVITIGRGEFAAVEWNCSDQLAWENEGEIVV